MFNRGRGEEYAIFHEEFLKKNVLLKNLKRLKKFSGNKNSIKIWRFQKKTTSEKAQSLF